MSLRQRSQSGLYVVMMLFLANMIAFTEYPAIPLADLTEIRLPPDHLECRAGCHLQLSDLPGVDCVVVDQVQPGQEQMIAKIGPVTYLCRPADGVELGQNIQFVVDSLHCQFPSQFPGQAVDTSLLIPSSCRLAYNLNLMLAVSEDPSHHSTGHGTHYGLRLFLSLLLVTFTILGLRECILNHHARSRSVQPQSAPIPLVSQVVADPKEMLETGGESERSRREERHFRQNHSAIREKSRARSRSRKRDLMK